MTFKKHRTAFIILIVALIGRAAFLEYTDLIDPTESRYAVVAQHMVHSGNWLTPMIPMPEGVVPYLGKPPLHFWLTALSYMVFGYDEWSSRLPSLFATMGILAAIWLFARKFFDESTAACASLIYLTSGMAYFLAGASVTDVTLTFLVTSSIAFLYSFIQNKDAPRRWLLASAGFAALSFMTKGPVSLVLIWFPILLFSFFRKDFSWIKRIPWLLAITVFGVMTVPWFVLSEISNPGFIKYFFWNENIARYLFKEYGDRYGSGHRHMYGASWVILIAEFCPWTPVLAYCLWKKGRQGLVDLAKSEPSFLFMLCWAVSTPLFFTFVRQLHGMYLLPAIPPLSILTAMFILSEFKISSFFERDAGFNYLSRRFLGFGGAIVVVVGAYLHFSFVALIASAIILAVAFWLLHLCSKSLDPVYKVSVFSTSLVGIYLIGLSSVTPFINFTRSAEQTLHQIAERHDCRLNEGAHEVGVISKNSFSHYWAAAAWESELPEKLNVSYVPLEQVKASHVCHFIIKAKSVSSLPKEITDNFKMVSHSGEWMVLARIKKDSHDV